MPGLVIFFGLIASGKSTLAEVYARRNQASYFNTDRVRKKLLGIKVTEHKPAGMGEGIYTPEMTRRTYQSMLDSAATILKQGGDVVLDGSYGSLLERKLVVECGELAGVSVRFVLCQCSDEETGRRLDLRRRDSEAVSDGRLEILNQQRKIFEETGEIDSNHLLVLNTEVELSVLVTKVTDWLMSSLP